MAKKVYNIQPAHSGKPAIVTVDPEGSERFWQLWKARGWTKEKFERHLETNRARLEEALNGVPFEERTT